MEQLYGAVIGAAAVLGIPIASWLSRRMSKEGRLILRIERLGAIYALMPESTEKTGFKAHLQSVVDELNQWMNLDNKRRRNVRLTINTLLYIGGAIVIFFNASYINSFGSFWLNILVGVVLGIVIAALSALVMWLYDLGEQYISEKKAKKAATQPVQENAAKEQAKALESSTPVAAEEVAPTAVVEEVQEAKVSVPPTSKS